MASSPPVRSSSHHWGELSEPQLVIFTAFPEPGDPLTPGESLGCLVWVYKFQSPSHSPTHYPLSVFLPASKPLHMLFLMPVMPFQLSPPQVLCHIYSSSCLTQNHHHDQGLLPSLSFCTPDPHILPLALETNLTAQGVTSMFHSLAHSHLTKHLLQGTYWTRD